MSGASGLRRPLVAGNWKMHLVRAEAAALAAAVRAGTSAATGGVEVALFPSFPLLPAVAETLAGSTIGCGGQDLHPAARGAFTGDVAAAQLLDVGCRYVLCGHSERRQGHGESDRLVAEKAAAAAGAGLLPVVCVGETGSERDRGETFAVLERQIAPLDPLPGLVLAYEPVWAIGTGKTATPELAEEAHRHLRRSFERRWGSGAESLRILYGGSVTPDNARGLAERPEIDGALVGGASLDPAKFLAIISAFAA